MKPTKYTMKDYANQAQTISDNQSEAIAKRDAEIETLKAAIIENEAAMNKAVEDNDQDAYSKACFSKTYAENRISKLLSVSVEDPALLERCKAVLSGSSALRQQLRAGILSKFVESCKSAADDLRAVENQHNATVKMFDRLVKDTSIGPYYQAVYAGYQEDDITSQIKTLIDDITYDLQR